MLPAVEDRFDDDRPSGLFTYLPGHALFRGLTYFNVLPAALVLLPFISSAFVPTGTMPGQLRAFAEHQPVTAIADTVRDLLTRQPVGGDIWLAPAWCLGVLVAACGCAALTQLAPRG